jgi:CheY-like chemotaxis protein
MLLIINLQSGLKKVYRKNIDTRQPDEAGDREPIIFIRQFVKHAIRVLIRSLSSSILQTSRRKGVGKPFKVLVIDDYAGNVFLATTLLKEAGYEVLEASTGQEGLDAVRAHRPDLIMLDVMLPDISGIEVCRQIKGDKSLKNIFVILVSGIQVSSEHQAEGLDIGADGYITRPISNKEFLARIQAGIRIKHAEDSLREALAEIKTLRGCIPICAWCKKVRNDEGCWDQLEAYISKHTDASFSHGLCPDCFEAHRTELDKLPENR